MMYALTIRLYALTIRLYALTIQYCIILYTIVYSSIAYCQDPIRVMVVDTGIDIVNHPELSEVLCPKGEHLDATTNQVRLPKDTHGHGTHVAGIIRALGGTKGYCLSICKFYAPEASNAAGTRSTIRCFKLAKALNAKYINYSAAGPAGSEEEKQAISDLAPSVVFVAAGNEGLNLDDGRSKCYPASYDLMNEIAVSALAESGRRLSSSNYGTVVLRQYPGERIYSTTNHGSYAYMSGTSQATAIATGTALRIELGLYEIANYWKYLLDFWQK